jgi:hypothetical protein
LAENSAGKIAVLMEKPEENLELEPGDIYHYHIRLQKVQAGFHPEVSI